MFDRKLFIHLLLGLIGVAAVTGAIYWRESGWPALVLIPIALIAWRGCPSCWLMGFCELAGRRDAHDGTK